MERPQPFGWYHILCVVLALAFVVVLVIFRKQKSETQLKIVLGVYGVVTVILEILKQVSWSMTVGENGVVSWGYQWYSAPFQFCTTPMYAALICLFLKNCRLRRALLSYIAYITILGSVAVMIWPSDCFVPDILVNVHTMWLHCGSFVVSVYLLMSGHIDIKKRSLLRASLTFLSFVFLAEALNTIIYNSGILQGQTFNMFYISPYFESTLPVFNMIWGKIPFTLFLFGYILAMILGGCLIFGIAFAVKKISDRIKK